MSDSQTPDDPVQAGKELQDPTDMEPNETPETDAQDEQTDESSLSVAWTGGMTYAVWSDGETQDAYSIDLQDLTCTCDHGQHNERDTSACYHIKAAIEAHDSSPDLKRFTFEQLADLFVKTHETLTTVQSATFNSGGQQQATTPTSDSEGGSGGSSLPEYREIDPNEAQYDMVKNLYEWFDRAAEFNGFDSDVIDLQYCEYDGQEGIHVNRNPFAGYYDTNSGEWVDQDGFDETKQAIKESVLTPRDEFEWIDSDEVANDWDYGKWWIPANKVSEVVE